MKSFLGTWFGLVLLTVLIYGGSIFLVIGFVVWCLRGLGVLR